MKGYCLSVSLSFCGRKWWDIVSVKLKLIYKFKWNACWKMFLSGKFVVVDVLSFCFALEKEEQLDYKLSTKDNIKSVRSSKFAKKKVEKWTVTQTLILIRI